MSAIENFSDVVHANYGKIVVDGVIVGAAQEITMRVSGDMSTLSQIGSPHIVGKQPANLRTDITFRVGFLDGNMLQKITGIPFEIDENGALKAVSVDTVDRNSPLNEYILHMDSFDILIYGFSGEGIDSDLDPLDSERVKISIPNVMLSSYDIEFRAGDFWLSNVEGTGDLMTGDFAKVSVTTNTT